MVRSFLLLVGAVAVTSGLLAVRRPSPAYADPGGEKVYWTENGTDTIRRGNLDGSDQETLIDTGLDTPISLALDVGDGRMYWSDSGTDKIQRAKLDGTEVEDVVTSTSTGGVAVDPVGRALYWTEPQSGKIRTAGLDGVSAADLVTGLDNPLEIALDLDGGKLYWTDNISDKVQRADLDGSNAEDVATTGLSTPQGIAVDTANDKVYWLDVTLGKIERADLDGANRETLIASGLNIPEELVLDPVQGKMYWSEAGADEIRRADLDGTNEELVASTGDIPFGLGLDLLTPPVGFVDVAVDPVAGKLYYSDFGTLLQGGEEVGRLRRADLDGTNQETIAAAPAPCLFPIGIDLDTMADKVYWTSRAEIHRANFDGTNDELLSAPAPCFLPAIALDPAAGHMYTTHAVSGEVRRSGLDGTNQTTQVSGLTDPRDIVVDSGAGHMYWTDSDPSAGGHRIMRSNLDGTGTVVARGPAPCFYVGLALDAGEGHMYYVDENPGRILRADLTIGPSGFENEEVLVTGLEEATYLALDTVNDKLYWTDDEGLKRADQDGSNQELLISTQGEVGGVAGLPDPAGDDGGFPLGTLYGAAALAAGTSAAAAALAASWWWSRRRAGYG